MLTKERKNHYSVHYIYDAYIHVRAEVISEAPTTETFMTALRCDSIELTLRVICGMASCHAKGILFLCSIRTRDCLMFILGNNDAILGPTCIIVDVRRICQRIAAVFLIMTSDLSADFTSYISMKVFF